MNHLTPKIVLTTLTHPCISKSYLSWIFFRAGGCGRFPAVPLEVACAFIKALKAKYLDHVSWPFITRLSQQGKDDIFFRTWQVGALQSFPWINRNDLKSTERIEILKVYSWMWMICNWYWVLLPNRTFWREICHVQLLLVRESSRCFLIALIAVSGSMLAQFLKEGRQMSQILISFFFPVMIKSQKVPSIYWR